MKPLLFTLLVLALMALVIGGLIHEAPKAQPGTDADGQPAKPKPSREMERQLVKRIWRKLNARN